MNLKKKNFFIRGLLSPIAMPKFLLLVLLAPWQRVAYESFGATTFGWKATIWLLIYVPLLAALIFYSDSMFGKKFWKLSRS